MDAEERAIFRSISGRTEPPTAQVKEAWLVCGRRAGKSFVTAVVGTFLAAFRDYRPYLAPGEQGTVMLLTADRRQARVLMRYVRGLLEGVPMLAHTISAQREEAIELDNGIDIEIHTASYRAVRGYTVVAALLDEVAFWRSEDSANPDREIVAALRPAMATIPGALLLGISSPYSRRGILFDAYSQHFGRNDSDVLVIQADSRTMNPTLPQSVIDRAYADDPLAAAAEYGAQFRADVDGFLQAEWIDHAVLEARHELPPQPGMTYHAFADPSGGGADAFTLALSHREGERLVLDVCRARRPPFSPPEVVAEYAAVLRRYGCTRVTGDRYAGEWVSVAFRDHSIIYEVAELAKSDIYLAAEPLFAQGAVQLLDNRQLLQELRLLERRTGAGKDRIDHPPRGHDDLANAACGALWLASRRRPIKLNPDDFVLTTLEDGRQAVAEAIERFEQAALNGWPDFMED